MLLFILVAGAARGRDQDAKIVQYDTSRNDPFCV